MANPWCRNSVTLFLHRFLHIVRPIGLCVNVCSGNGCLLKSYPDSSISLYAYESNPWLVCPVSRLLSSWSKPLEEVVTPFCLRMA